MTVNAGDPINFILDGQNVAQEWVDADQDQVIDPDETVTYLNGPRGVEYRLDDATGQMRWYLYDGLGSVIAEVDENGSITATRKYDVYGAPRTGSDEGTGDQKFCGSLGHTTESETGGLISICGRDGWTRYWVGLLARILW